MERTCIVCRKKGQKEDLVRVVKFADGKIAYDPTGKAQGRGCYICREGKCVSLLHKSGALARSFRCTVDASVYELIEEELREQ